MADERDPLQQLWLQQQVNVPSIEVLKSRWRKEKTKQAWYAVMDIVGLLVGPLLLLLMRDNMHWFERSWLFVVVVGFTFYTAYIIWLRRVALGFKNTSTSDYCSLLRHQFRQNIKIAKATKISTLALPPVFLIMFIGLYYLEVFELERLLRKIGFASLALAISLPPLWVWADKRAKRFQRELALLSEQAPLL